MKQTQRESVQEYLSRGGNITTCDPHHQLVDRFPSTSPRPTPAPAQARSNASWGKYLDQLVNDDVLGAYVSFSLTTTASIDVLARVFHRRCLAATNIYNPIPRSTLNRKEIRKWSRSQLAHRGTMVFLLPSTSAAGLYHYHGLVRTPREWSHSLLPLTHYVNGKKEEVKVPTAVDFVLGKVRKDASNDLLRNINLTHDGDRVVLLHENAAIRASVIAYYQKTKDGEVRDFTQAQFIPHIIRKALPNANTTKERMVA